MFFKYSNPETLSLSTLSKTKNIYFESKREEKSKYHLCANHNWWGVLSGFQSKHPENCTAETK